MKSTCPTFPISDASGLNRSVLPLSNLFLLFSDACNAKSPVSPLSPNILRVTLASVPAPRTSPVFTDTWYEVAATQQDCCRYTALQSLKRKCRHFDEILITGCTGSCHFDNFQCSQWWKFHQNEDISVSVMKSQRCQCVPKHKQLDCLFNRSFRQQQKKTWEYCWIWNNTHWLIIVIHRRWFLEL